MASGTNEAGVSQAGEGPATEGPTTVPGSADAVDVPCPHCGRRPIETVAKGYRITGMILLVQRKTLRFVGCQSCIRRKLWWAAVKNVFLGWWGIKAAIMNPFAIGWNVVRSFVSRGPNENLVDALEGTDIPYEFIDDKAAFDPAAHHDEELYLDGMLKLATAIVQADDRVEDAEVDATVDVAVEMFEDYDRPEIDERVQEFMEEGDVSVAEVSQGLGTMLTDEGKQLVLAFAMQVAAAGEEPGDEEMELVGEIAGNLGVSEQDVEQLLAE